MPDHSLLKWIIYSLLEGGSGREEGRPTRFAHFDAAAGGEDEPGFGAAFSEDFAGEIDVDDGGAVDAHEERGIERGGELFDGFAEQEGFCADVDASVVVSGFDPFDFGDVDEEMFEAVGDKESLRIGGAYGFILGEGFEETSELLMRGERGFCGDGLFDVLERGVQALGFDGFRQIVDGVNFEGSNGVSVVSGDKNGGGHVCGADFLDDVEAGVAGHMDVQKNEIDGLGFEGGENFAAVATLFDNYDFRIGGEEKAETLSGEGFVIDDEGFEFHFSGALVGDVDGNFKAASAEGFRFHSVAGAVEMGESLAGVAKADAVAVGEVFG